jgi:hypothetical protein
MSTGLLEPPDQGEPLVTNHSPAVIKPRIPADLVARMTEIHTYYGKRWLTRADRKPPNVDWELDLQMREIAYTQALAEAA